MTAVGLLARWCLDSLTSPPRPDELVAVAHLRLLAAARLDPAQRDALLAILATTPPTKETPKWH